MSAERPIKLKPAYVDGCNVFSFVHFELEGKDLVVYAISNERETHAMIAQYAIEEEYVDNTQEPAGGGVFDARTGEYLRGSIHYGEAQARIIEAIDRKLDDIIEREC
jgi:hypothetical protein